MTLLVARLICVAGAGLAVYVLWAWALNVGPFEDEQ